MFPMDCNKLVPSPRFYHVFSSHSQGSPTIFGDFQLRPCEVNHPLTMNQQAIEYHTLKAEYNLDFPLLPG